MFNLSGKQLQIIAKVICILGIAASVISGAIMCSISVNVTANPMYAFWDTHPFLAAGVGVMIGGSVCSWLGSCFLAAIGRLVEDHEKLLSMLEKIKQ